MRWTEIPVVLFCIVAAACGGERGSRGGHGSPSADGGGGSTDRMLDGAVSLDGADGDILERDASPPRDASVAMRDAAQFVDASLVDEDSDPRCGDGVDNDGDGFTDCGDYSCSRNPAVTVCGREDDDALCSDGVDNDGDGYVDCDDFDCSRNSAIRVCGTGPQSGVGWSVAECNGEGVAELVGLGSTSGQHWDGPAVWISNSSANTIFAYTKDEIASGPFPNAGVPGQYQVRLEFAYGRPQSGAVYAAVLGVFEWDSGSARWTTVEGSTSASVEIVNVSIDDAAYADRAWCAGVLVGRASAPLFTGADVLTFAFTAPLLAPGFPR